MKSLLSGFAKRHASTVAPTSLTPRNARSIPVTTILFQDQSNLLTWASGFAADYVRGEAEERAGKELFSNDWDRHRKIAAEKHRDYSEQRMAVGSRVHDAVNKLTNIPKGSTFNVEAYKDNEEVYQCVRAMTEWHAKGRYEILQSEFVVKSETHRYHGKVDCAARDVQTKEVILLDFKVKPKELDFTTAMQLAAYIAAYNEMNRFEVSSPAYCRSAIAVQIKYTKEKGAQVVEKRVRNLEEALYGFHCRHILHRIESENPLKAGMRNAFADSWIFSPQ